MTRPLIRLSTFVATCSLCMFVYFGLEAEAKQPKVKQISGHVSPVMAEVTERDGKVKRAMVIGTSARPGPGGSVLSHQFECHARDGSTVILWLDTIRLIEPQATPFVRVVFKDGTEQEVELQQYDSNAIRVHRPEGGRDSFNLTSVKSVRFVREPRKDRSGNAMLDEWKYSPFTGEELPDIE